MKLRYTFSNIGKGNSLKSREEAIKSTDEAAKEMRNLIKVTSELISGNNLISRFSAWILSHAYKRKVTNEYIEYNFYLIAWLSKRDFNK